MRKEIIWIAEDGSCFQTEGMCRDYEEKRKQEKGVSDRKLLWELDRLIWKKFYPNQKTEESDDGIKNVGGWLQNDITYILLDEAIDSSIAEKEILSMINDTGIAEKMLTRYLSFDKIKLEVNIKKDYLSAFGKVRKGSELAHDIGYALSSKDLMQLAKLHRSNKCRKKIEDLLTCCNFHYECSKFANKKYAEFLS